MQRNKKMLSIYRRVFLLGVMVLAFTSSTTLELRGESDDREEPVSRKKSVKKIVHVESDTESEEESGNNRSKKRKTSDREEKDYSDEESEKKTPIKRIRYVIKKKKREEPIKQISREQEEVSQNMGDDFKGFSRYSRPQLYFSPSAPWRVIYFSPNISYQGMVPVEGDTNLSLQDKEWCLNLKTKEPDKSCANFDFLKKVARKCEDVQVLSCIEHAKNSSWAQEKWQNPQEVIEGIQAIFHNGMELRIREFVDRGGKLPWVPTPPWCMNVSPKSCSDLDQFDPRTGVNQGGKNFITSAENCHFYEVANCTAEAIDSQWARKRWGDDEPKIRTEINKFIFEKHLERITKQFPASNAVSEEEAKKAESMKMSSSQRLDSMPPSFAVQQVKAMK